jgi:integrase
VIGLEVDDVGFERRTVTFRPNARRGRLKGATSWRVVPLWPQKVLDQLAARAGFLHAVLDPVTSKQRNTSAGQMMWTGRRIRPHMLRHTYCAARLQTLDRGLPVSEYTVAKELGHGGPDLVRRIYGHLGTVRHRSEMVEYRVGRHVGILRDPLARPEAADRAYPKAAAEVV